MNAGSSEDEWLGIEKIQRGSTEFSRTLNLSDGVFAIAMTLLVLSLEIPTEVNDDLGGILVEQAPQFIAFFLSFGFVAHIWWQHQKIVYGLSTLEPTLIGINLGLLGAVALVPYPTSLVGSYPTERMAVLSLIGIFLVLTLFWLLLVWRAQSIDAWREPMPERVWYWHLATWFMGVIVLCIAALVTLLNPMFGLIVIGVSVSLGPVASRWSYRPLFGRS